MSAGSGFGSADQVTRRISDLERKQKAQAAAAGIVAGIGSFTLPSDGSTTSTDVTDAKATASSKIFCAPASADAWSLDGALNGITAGSGSFSVSHPASTLSRTYNYIVVNPA